MRQLNLEKALIWLALIGVTIFVATYGLWTFKGKSEPPAKPKAMPTKHEPLDTDQQLTEMGLLPTQAPPTQVRSQQLALPTPTEGPTPETEEQRYNFLVLGGDYRQWREGSRWGNKTDVMLLASVKLGDPNQITVFQFNRNFYHPVEAMDDQWLFAVYGREGYPGLHYYFQEVFGVPLTGIAYVNMDNFIKLVDRLGGLWIGGEPRDGEWVLEYLRDNENMWGCVSYDCENRQFMTLVRLIQEFNLTYLKDEYDYLDAAELVWFGLTDVVETDISTVEQFYYLASIAWELKRNPPEIHGPFKMDEWENFAYGDTPLEVRGWIEREDFDVSDWIPGIWRAFP